VPPALITAPGSIRDRSLEFSGRVGFTADEAAISATVCRGAANPPVLSLDVAARPGAITDLLPWAARDGERVRPGVSEYVNLPISRPNTMRIPRIERQIDPVIVSAGHGPCHGLSRRRPCEKCRNCSQHDKDHHDEASTHGFLYPRYGQERYEMPQPTWLSLHIVTVLVKSLARAKSAPARSCYQYAT
jgi:hypothetical protein